MTDQMKRHYAGREALQKLLAASGTLADVEDIAQAFKQAVADNVPPAIVIQALWDDEPRFESPADARELFSNLLGLFDLIAEGGPVDLKAARSPRVKKVKAEPPSPWKDAPDDLFVEAAWRYLDDHPREREKLQHTFENKQDALISWLDASGLSDEGFGTAQALCSDVYAVLSLGGVSVPVFDERQPPLDESKAPAALIHWVDDALNEATSDEERPMPETEAERVRNQVITAIAQWWSKAQTH